MGDVPRGYRVWVAASTVSQVGDTALYLALGWAASGYGGTAVGLVLAAITVPRTLLGLLGGAVVDRVGPRPVLLVTDGLLLAACAAAGVVAVVAGPSLGLLITVALALGALTAVGHPAGAALPAGVVAPDALPRALALRQAGYQTASLGGGPAGGLLLAAGGLGLVLGVNALSFALVIAATLALPAVRPPRSPAGRAGVGDAVALAVRTPALRRVLVLYAVTAGVWFPLGSVLTPLLARERGWSAVDVGLVAGAQGAGALVAAAVVARLGTSRHTGPATAGGLALTAGAAVGLAAAPVPAVAVGAGVLLGVGLGVFLAHVAPLVVALSPRTHLGRVQALLGVAQSAVLVGTNLLFGALTAAAGAGAGLVVVAAALAGAALASVRGLAEADGNRTRLAEMLDHVGVEDRGGHQAP